MAIEKLTQTLDNLEQSLNKQEDDFEQKIEAIYGEFKLLKDQNHKLNKEKGNIDLSNFITKSDLDDQVEYLKAQFSFNKPDNNAMIDRLEKSLLNKFNDLQL